VLRVPRLSTCQILEERTRNIDGNMVKSYHPVYEPNLMIQPLGTTPFRVFIQATIKKRLRMWVRAKHRQQSRLREGTRYIIRDRNGRKKKTKAKGKERE
jgi:hypothetical protein